MTVVFLLLLILLLSGIYWPFLSGQANFFFEDATHFFEPLCKFIGGSLARGHLPLWSPLSYCGMPQLAISSPGLFYPFTWLFATMPFSQALSFIMVFHQVLAGFSIYLLALSWRLNKWAAAAAGFAVALSGYFFSVTGNFTIACAAAWFCFCLFSFCRLSCAASNKQRLAFTLLSVLGVAMLVLAGRPEIFAPAMLFLLAYIACNSWQGKYSFNMVALSDQVKALFIGVLFSMPSILPLIEWLPFSRRSEGLFAGEVLLFSANWYDFLGLIAAQPLGDLQRLNSPLLGLVAPSKWMPYISSAYVGIAAVTCALWGACGKGHIYRRLFLTLLIVSLITAAGSNLPPVIYLVQHISALSILRFPVKLLFFAVVALAVLAGFGLQDFCDGKPRLWLATAFSICLLASGIFLQLNANNILLPFETDFTFAWQRFQGQQLIALSLIQAGSLALVVNLAVYIPGQREALRKYMVALLLACIVGSLLLQSLNYYLKSAPTDFYSKPSQLAELINAQRAKYPGDSSGRLATLYLEPFTRSKFFHYAEDGNVNAFQYDRQILFANSNMDCSQPAIYGFEGAMVGDYYYFFLNSYIKSSLSLPEENRFSPVARIGGEQESVADAQTKSDVPLFRFLQSGSCQFATTQISGTLVTGKHIEIKILDPQMYQLLEENKTLNIRLYRLKETRPRAYLSHRALVFADRNKLISYMFNAEKSNYDPSQATLLEKKPDIDTLASAQAEGEEAVSLEETNTDKLQATVTVAKPGLLVLCDQYYPGWKAFVDGREAEIYRANGFFRAVAVTAGKHKVVFSYQPASLNGALLVVALSFFWLVVIALQLMGKSAVTTHSSD